MGSVNISTAAVMTTPIIISTVRFWDSSSSASRFFFCAINIAIMVLEPTANITAMANSRLVNGSAKLTALMAYSPTPRATISPSTTE